MSGYLKSEMDRKFNTSGHGVIITLEGPISVGKSTLGKSINNRGTFLGRSVVYLPEHVNHEYLSLYLSDQSKYSFSYQTYALSWRFIIHAEAERWAQSGYCVIIDRGLVGDLAFALMQKQRGFFTQEDWKVYWSLILEHQKSQWKPDLTVYLNCTSDEAFSRLKRRGDPKEISSYNVEYFEQLQQGHTDAFKIYDQVIGDRPNVLNLDWTSVDFDGDELPESTIVFFEDMVKENLNSEPVVSVQ